MLVAKVAETFEPVHPGKSPSKTRNTETRAFRYVVIAEMDRSVPLNQQNGFICSNMR